MRACPSSFIPTPPTSAATISPTASGSARRCRSTRRRCPRKRRSPNPPARSTRHQASSPDPGTLVLGRQEKSRLIYPLPASCIASACLGLIRRGRPMSAIGTSNEKKHARREQRFAVDLAAVLRGGTEDVPVRLRDLSRGGALGTCLSPPPALSNVTLLRGTLAIEARV